MPIGDKELKPYLPPDAEARSKTTQEGRELLQYLAARTGKTIDGAIILTNQPEGVGTEIVGYWNRYRLANVYYRITQTIEAMINEQTAREGF